MALMAQFTISGSYLHNTNAFKLAQGLACIRPQLAILTSGLRFRSPEFTKLISSMNQSITPSSVNSSQASSLSLGPNETLNPPDNEWHLLSNIAQGCKSGCNLAQVSVDSYARRAMTTLQNQYLGPNLRAELNPEPPTITCTMPYETQLPGEELWPSWRAKRIAWCTRSGAETSTTLSSTCKLIECEACPTTQSNAELVMLMLPPMVNALALSRHSLLSGSHPLQQFAPSPVTLPFCQIAGPLGKDIGKTQSPDRSLQNPSIESQGNPRRRFRS
ncbi:hypothetical protein JAAARDRAFT_51335 [Jaapia argillacea MUCL 33604]|uniref:Uncharacterized protein n=1 Tax=Jaapia argillacea MUCL 33604 TaxID=933084 RepID=A0A067P662_9AGAM|nr:hypothetical protein JAAARDRAFT_51335 [Jaapia argillacea MUCL 33604]